MKLILNDAFEHDEGKQSEVYLEHPLGINDGVYSIIEVWRNPKKHPNN